MHTVMFQLSRGFVFGSVSYRTDIAWHDTQAQRPLYVVSRHAWRLITAFDDDNGVCAPLNILLHAPFCQVVPNMWRSIVDRHLTC